MNHPGTGIFNIGDAGERPLLWIGSSKKDLIALPVPVRRFFGHALNFAQRGERHDAAKILKGFGGAGMLEIIEDDAGSTYRAVYTVRFQEAVFVLHVFQKKSKRGIETPQTDMTIIRRRLKVAAIVAQELKDEKANR
ncbi:MAG: type II toxin-antitoxin system RelE/ParE family toxin [Burkholderiales bacterium]|nr:type II toxin-antitoxin system RelE/ParE family toxin [Burkholderiales bacterium]